VATLGRQMTVVALPYQVWVTTRSPLAVGLVGVVQAAAIIIAGAYGGPLADRSIADASCSRAGRSSV
jgi:hypothetical protein